MRSIFGQSSILFIEVASRDDRNRLCQRELCCEGQGGDLALYYDKTFAFPLLQSQPRDNPPCGDALRQISAVASEC